MAAVGVVLASLGYQLGDAGLLDRRDVRLGFPFARGAFGSLHEAQLGLTRCVAKRAVLNSADAEACLQSEACLNAKVCDEAPGSRHLAPFLGVCSLGRVDHIVWRRLPGAESNLLAFLEPVPRLPTLARDLGVVGEDATGPLTLAQEDSLARALLREILECCATLHAAGVVHRDVKPENLLVDSATKSLRIIDLGTACELDGPGGSNRLATALYCPPEQTRSGAVTEGYDVYSSAVVWLQVAVPAFRSSRASLVAFVEAVRDRREGLDATRDDYGLADSVLGRDAAAAGLLASMLAPEPRDRITALEALASPYFAEADGSWHHPVDGGDDDDCMGDFSCHLAY